MPGSLLKGYLAAERRSQEQASLADEKKMQKLEESLNQLRLKGLTQTLARDAREWEIQDRVRQEKEAALQRLGGLGFNVDLYQLGEKQPEDKFAGVRKLYPDLNIEALTGLKELGGVEAVKKAAPGMFPEDLPGSLPATWKSAPTKHNDAVQKWVGEWNKHIFDPAVLAGGMSEKAFGGLKTAGEKTQYFNAWAKQIPQELRAEVRKDVGMETSTAGRKGGGETKESILSAFKGAGIKKINAQALKSDYPWLTEEDLSWIQGNL